MPAPAFELSLPAVRSTSVIFASPHSGKRYSAAFLRSSVLDERTIRSSEDAFVDQLLSCVPSLGAPLLAAVAPRAYVDLNRAPDELDPALVEGVRSVAHNPRISSGLGVIPRVVAGGKAIYRNRITRAEAETRISRWWRPYHDQLQMMMDDARRSFGHAILVDMHSMPHEAIDSFGFSSGRRPEIVIGDRFGAAASVDIVDGVHAAFEKVGLRVARNAPFAGAYIAQTYGRPGRNQHCVQIELDRALYMNEREIRPNGNFNGFRTLLSQVLSDVADVGRRTYQLAAE